MFIPNKYSKSLIGLLIIIIESLAETCPNYQLQQSSRYLDDALDSLKKAKDSYPSEFLISKPRDCDDIFASGSNKSGIYTIWPISRVTEGRDIKVYCDMDIDGGGWTVIQRRGNFDRPVDYFYKDWESYRKGFGDLNKDFWLGNDNIFAISNQKQYSARFDLKDMEGQYRYAHYDIFWIDDEYHKYMLHINGYRGNAGDSMYPKHNEMMFSTKDRKNDNGKYADGCAVQYKGAWWYNKCHDSNLNGMYLWGQREAHAVNWQSWKNNLESLEWAEIKLRPKDSKRAYHTHTSTPQ